MTAIIGRGREREHPRNINISRERCMSYLHYIGPTTFFFQMHIGLLKYNKNPRNEGKSLRNKEIHCFWSLPVLPRTPMLYDVSNNVISGQLP